MAKYTSPKVNNDVCYEHLYNAKYTAMTVHTVNISKIFLVLF